MKKVLIITYYWPPSGGAGVQRWLKFVKYLRDFGWEPVVYTPLNPEIPYHDESFLKDVPQNIKLIGTKIFEPYQLYNLFTGKPKNQRFQHGMLKDQSEKHSSLAEKAAIWIRGNLFIPDARAFWIKPSVKFLSGWLKEQAVDLIVSTGPPHSMHLIARKLKQKTGLPWIADFRDPWTGIYYFDQLLPGWLARKKHLRLEQCVLDEADHLITVGKTMKKDFSARTKTPITVISNGFDEADYPKMHGQISEKFQIFYSGMFLPDQNPPELWAALGELVREDADFAQALELKFVGKTDAGILRNVHDQGLDKWLALHDYVPHAALPALQQQAALLLLSINRIQNASYILTGKVFEYLAAQRPVLAICPTDSDVAQIIKQTNSGYVVGFDQKDELKALLLKLFHQHQLGLLKTENQHTEPFTRKNLTQQLAMLMDRCSH